MNPRIRTYTAYSAGVGIVWALLLVLASLLDPAGKRSDIFLVFSGFVIGWLSATALLALSFAVIYYWAPNVKQRCWRWLTPGGALGILFWLLASLGLRLYIHFFNFYSLTYGSLGAVIILLMWFYITGLMLLLGAEINSEIEAAAAEKRLAAQTLSNAANTSVTPPAI